MTIIKFCKARYILCSYSKYYNSHSQSVYIIQNSSNNHECFTVTSSVNDLFQLFLILNSVIHLRNVQVVNGIVVN